MNIQNHWKQIFIFLNYKSIINLTYVSKKINYFVKKNILDLLPKFPDKFIINSIYLKELFKKGFKFLHDINALIKYCKNIENFKFLLGFKYINIDKFFIASCKLNNLEIVELMIEKGANNWIRGLESACSTGNLEIVELMIQKGANDWNKGLYKACFSGNLEIVELMIQKGANNWNWGLYNSCFSRNLKIVELMIQKGANDWNWGLYYACLSGNLEIVELMIKKGANDCLYCRNRKHIF